MATIGSLAVNLVARTEKFSSGLKRARREVGAFANGLSSARSLVAGFGATMAAGFAARSLKQTADDMDRINRTAARMKGVTTEALSGLEYAAKITDVPVNKLTQGLTILTTKLSDAKRGSAEALDPFQRLGVDIDKLSRMSTDRALGEIADRLNAIPDAGDRAGAAAALFGRKVGPDLQAMLKLGSAGITDLVAEAERLGVTFSQADADKIDAMNDAIDRMTLAWEGLKRELVTGVAPAIETVVTKITAAIEADRRFLMGTEKGPRQAKANDFINKLSDSNFHDFIRANKFEEMDEFVTKAAADRAAKMQAQAKTDKATSAAGVAEAPARMIGSAMGMFSQLAGDGADALGKLGSKLRETEQKANLAALKQSFGFGPFDASKMGKPAGPLGPSAEIDPARIAALFSGRGGVELRGNAALEKGTAAAFSQERRSQQQGQVVSLLQQQLAAQKATVKAITNIKGKDLGAQLLPANVV